MQIKIKIVSCHAADSKSVKQEVNGTVILPPNSFRPERLVPAQVEQLPGAPLWSRHISLGGKCLPGTNALAYFDCSIVTKKKKV